MAALSSILPHAFGISINLENSSDWFPVLPDAIGCDGHYKLVTWYITSHIHVTNLKIGHMYVTRVHH